MPSSGTEVHSFNEVWTKKHLTLPIKSNKSDINSDIIKEDFDDLLHLKCRLINTAGNEQSEVDVKLPYERSLNHRKGSPVYTLGKKEKPTLDVVLGSIPLVYNPHTKQLELESRSDNQKNNKLISSKTGDGTCVSMDRDGSLVQRDRPLSERLTVDDDLPDVRCRNKFSSREKTETLGRKVEEAEKDIVEENGEDVLGENYVPHSPTSASLQHTDTSSFTSMSSVGTEHSFCIGEPKNGSNPSLCYSCDNLQNLNDDLHKGAKPKKWGFSNLFLK